MAVKVLKSVPKRIGPDGKPGPGWVEITILKFHPPESQMKEFERYLLSIPKGGAGLYKLQGGGKTQKIVVEAAWGDARVIQSFENDNPKMFDVGGESEFDYSEELEALDSRLENIEKILASHGEVLTEVSRIIEKAKQTLSPEILMGLMNSFTGEKKP